MYLPPDPDLYKNLPVVLSNHKVLPLTTQERHTLEARLALDGRGRFYCRALCWFGRRLIAWGTSLMERYGRPTEQQMLPQAH